MATELDLKWEWPAGRQPAMVLIIAVAEVTEPGQARFGIEKSPSLLRGLPDPVTVHGTVIGGEAGLVNSPITLTLPKLEAAAIGGGDVAAIGVLRDGVCICIRKLESSAADIATRQC